jgi:hypothetical protein
MLELWSPNLGNVKHACLWSINGSLRLVLLRNPRVLVITTAFLSLHLDALLACTQLSTCVAPKRGSWSLSYSQVREIPTVYLVPSTRVLHFVALMSVHWFNSCHWHGIYSEHLSFPKPCSDRSALLHHVRPWLLAASPAVPRRIFGPPTPTASPAAQHSLNMEERIWLVCGCCLLLRLRNGWQQENVFDIFFPKVGASWTWVSTYSAALLLHFSLHFSVWKHERELQYQ